MAAEPRRGGAPARHARHYDQLARWGRAPDAANRLRLARTHALIPPGARRILDVGCGDGTSSNDLVGSGALVVAADLSPRAVRLAAGRPVVASIDALPFPDRAFDVVLALEVVEHLPDAVLPAALGELARVAGGHLVVSTPNEEVLEESLARCAACGAVFHRNLHARRYDRADHRALFDGLGFAHRVTVPVATWRQHPLFTRLRHAVGGRHAYRPVLVCPACGRPGAAPERPPLARRAAIRLTHEACRRLARPRPRWIVSRYARSGT